MMKGFTFLLAAITIIYFSSCSPVYYAPNTQNVPLLSHEGEYNVSVTGGNSLIDIQSSVSPVHHLGLQLNGTYYIPHPTDKGDYGNGFMIDAGAGYYLPFGFDDHFVLEAYGIGGIGGVYNYFNYRDSATTGGSISTNAARYGVQPIMGYKSRYFDVAVSSRFIGLSYFNTQGDLMYGSMLQTDYLSRNQHNFIVEPALTLRAGADFLKFQIQVQGSFNTNHPDFYQSNSGITIGLIFSPNNYRNIFQKRSDRVTN